MVMGKFRKKIVRELTCSRDDYLKKVKCVIFFAGSRTCGGEMMLKKLYGGTFIDSRCLIVLQSENIKHAINISHINAINISAVEIDDLSTERSRIFSKQTSVDIILQKFLNANSFGIFERSLSLHFFARKYSWKSCFSDRNPMFFK